MAKVSLTINGRSYEIACDDGQEDHLRTLGGELDRRVGELARQIGQVGDSRLLVMAGLLVADELSQARLKTAEGGARAAEAETAAMADAVARLADRIDAIAARLERP